MGRISCNKMPLTFRHVLDAVRLILPTDCLSIQTEYIPPPRHCRQTKIRAKTNVLFVRERSHLRADLERMPKYKCTKKTHTQTLRATNVPYQQYPYIHKFLPIYDLICSWTTATKRLLNQTRICQKCNVINWGYMPGN